ncbi:lipid-A-disaccharide synthase [Rhizobium sp. L1K21]|nr:lipid-A-disaccharide synthase [Rhizobium sp. L1K21]
MNKPLKVAVIAGEVSGDLLGAELIASLRSLVGNIELIGVGGPKLEEQGLRSLFDFSELSIMGYVEILARLPKLLGRVRQTAQNIIREKPDLLLIVDSPVFTHRVAKIVRDSLPDLPVVQYVCPSVWAWKEYRAPKMKAYVDLVLALLPFETEAMKRLGGPETVYVGHRLACDPALAEVRERRKSKVYGGKRTILLLPGSRSSEIKRTAPYFAALTMEVARRYPDARFVMPTVPARASLIEATVADWPVKPEWSTDETFKYDAFAEADAAIATSGTVIFELAMAGVPAVSIYKTDFLTPLLAHRIKIWSAAIPNLVADFPVVPEYVDLTLRADRLARWAIRLSDSRSLHRDAMMEGYRNIWEKMWLDEPSGLAAAKAVHKLLEKKKAG